MYPETLMSATIYEFEQRLRDTEDRSLENRMNLGAHEKECAIRYTQINDSIASIKSILLKVGGSLLLEIPES
jgi:hypothetical protein